MAPDKSYSSFRLVQIKMAPLTDTKNSIVVQQKSHYLNDAWKRFCKCFRECEHFRVIALSGLDQFQNS